MKPVAGRVTGRDKKRPVTRFERAASRDGLGPSPHCLVVPVPATVPVSRRPLRRHRRRHRRPRCPATRVAARPGCRDRPRPPPGGRCCRPSAEGRTCPQGCSWRAPVPDPHTPAGAEHASAYVGLFLIQEFLFRFDRGDREGRPTAGKLTTGRRETTTTIVGTERMAALRSESKCRRTWPRGRRTQAKPTPLSAVMR